MEEVLYKEKRLGTRRPEILRAALELFARKGVRATTVKDIARKARVAEGALYRHWKSKKELAEELFCENMKHFKACMEAEIEGFKGTKLRVKRVVGAFYTFAEKEPMVYRFLIQASLYELSYLLPRTSKPLDLFVRIIQEGIESGELKKVEPPLAAAFIIGAITKLPDFREMGILKKELKDYIDPLIELLWEGLKARNGLGKTFPSWKG
ncbi:MAG TPA: TetR/AcrR family transcriptional regulator [Candidatus Hypogeohydataceae bacterium YC41]